MLEESLLYTLLPCSNETKSYLQGKQPAVARGAHTFARTSWGLAVGVVVSVVVILGWETAFGALSSGKMGSCGR